MAENKLASAGYIFLLCICVNFADILKQPILFQSKLLFTSSQCVPERFELGVKYKPMQIMPMLYSVNCYHKKVTAESIEYKVNKHNFQQTF